MTSNIEKMIISAASKDWQKTAMVISKVFDNPKFDNTYSAQDVAAIIGTLIEGGKLSSQGNIRRWRDSSVRLVD